MIVDSGNRTKFKTGAVRDVQEDKGRCDLLPLSTISDFYLREPEPSVNVSEILRLLEKWKKTKDINHIYSALRIFSSEKWETYEEMFMEVSMHYKEGAKKYTEYNWQKGIPTHSFLDSGVRHLLKCKRGDTDERHDRAFVWNMLGLAWTIENKPELDDVILPE